MMTPLKIVVLLGASSIFLTSGQSLAQSRDSALKNELLFGKKSGGLGKFKRLKPGASNSRCGTWAREGRHKRGKNIKRNGETYFIALSKKPINISANDPGFADGRYIAFREAMMDAKGKMVKHLEALVKSEALSRIQKGKLPERAPTPARQNDDQVNSPSGGGIRGIFDTATMLLNIKLDNALKSNGYDPQAKSESERNRSAKAAENILQSKTFQEFLTTTAKSKLKGVFAKFAFENIPSAKDGTICVAAYYSTKSEKLADAMASRDFSNAPRSSARKRPLDEQIASDVTDEGVMELLSAFGISIHVDENGDFNIVSYAQAEIDDVNNDISVEVAQGMAITRAEASIRRFINESVSLNRTTATARKIDDLNNKMRAVKYNNAYFKNLEEKSEAFPINGMFHIREWSAQHPISGHGITGVVIGWNVSSAAGAIVDRARINKIPEDTGGRAQSAPQRRLHSTDRKSYGTGRSFRGGKRPSDEDF